MRGYIALFFSFTSIEWITRQAFGTRLAKYLAEPEMTSPNQLPYNQQTQISICTRFLDLNAVEPPSADELCDDLTLHVFECQTCLDEGEEACPVYQQLYEEIERLGGPVQGRILAM